MMEHILINYYVKTLLIHLKMSQLISSGVLYASARDIYYYYKMNKAFFTFEGKIFLKIDEIKICQGGYKI